MFKKLSYSKGGLEWEEISKLGRGGFGEVFLWKHRKSGETKAVKRVRYGQDGTAVPDEVKQLQREIDILKILKHPNIVEYYDNDIINSYLVILMEFVPGGSVHGLIEKKGVLTEKQASRYTKQTLQGLTYLHSNNIIHRDIKCANMLIGEGDVIKICDFGTSRRLNILHTATCSKLTQNVGTMNFMAPEMFKGRRGASKQNYSSKVDTWATGCSVEEMLTGSPPWKDYEHHEFLIEIIQSDMPDFKLPEHISKVVHDFLAQCFCHDPQERPEATELLHHSFCVSLDQPQNTESCLVQESVNQTTCSHICTHKAMKQPFII